jgi:hypothetical protein
MQLGVVFIGVPVSVWLGIRIANQAEEIAGQKTELEQQLKVVEYVQGAARLLSDPAVPGNYDRAIEQLRLARDLMPQERPLVRTLAEALFANHQSASALETLSGLASPEESDVINLAKYTCAAAKEDVNGTPEVRQSAFESAKAMILSSLPEERRASALDDEGFVGACPETLVSEIRKQVLPTPAADPSRIESTSSARYRIRRVFPHIRVESDRAAAIALGTSLCNSGYEVPGIELVPAPRPYPRQADLRFYYEEQRAEAQHIASLVAGASTPARWMEPGVRLLSGYQNLPEDQVELWVPESGRTLGSSGSPDDGSRFSCAPKTSTGVKAMCAQYDDYSAARWRTDFLGTTRPGTWHVFVASVGPSLQEAERRAESFRKTYPRHNFAVMPTVSATGGNAQYAVVIAEGLEDGARARQIAQYARECHVAADAFAWQQP